MYIQPSVSKISLLCFTLLFSASCSKDIQALPTEEMLLAEQEALIEAQNTEQVVYEIAPTWLPLKERLKNDGLEHELIDYYLSQLDPEPLEKPMGTKIKELYTNKFVVKTPSSNTTTSSKYDYPPKSSKIPGPWYKNFVTNQNAKLCIDFINQYPDAFQNAEEIYGVAPEVAAALLFIETRLGSYLGVDNAFVTLASMSSTKDISQIPSYIEKLPNDPMTKSEWINQKMSERSDWAYKELKAYLEHILANNLDPFAMPSSVYGAIGLCQFMPSNLKPYAVDGDGDNVVDLFNPPDAIHSLANYLKKYGWKPTATLAQQQATLKKYNNLTVYANTILALAEKVREVSTTSTAQK